MKRRTWIALALLVAVHLAPPRLSRADERPPRIVGLHFAAGVLGVSVGLSDLFSTGDEERIRSGFATRVLLRVELLREGVRGAEPMALAACSSEIAYDLWDEKFRVKIWEVQGRSPRAFEGSSAQDAIRAATTLIRFPVAPLDKLEPGSTYRLRLRADLDPISEEAAGEVRRWLVRPPEQGRSSGDTVFGSFVSLFVNPRIEESERQISFSSQLFTVRSRQ